MLKYAKECWKGVQQYTLRVKHQVYHSQDPQAFILGPQCEQADQSYVLFHGVVVWSVKMQMSLLVYIVNVFLFLMHRNILLYKV